MLLSRRALLVSASAAALAACAPVSTVAATPHPAPPSRLELRAGSDRLVLDGAVLDVREVRDPERDGIALSVELGQLARQRIEQFTTKHVGERVAVLVGGRAVMSLTIRDPVTVPSLLLTGTDDAAVREMQRELAANP